LRIPSFRLCSATRSWGVSRPSATRCRALQSVSASACHGSAGDAEAAPLLCAGLIGYRSLKMTGEPVPWQPSPLGIYGFGAAAHIVAQVARHEGREIYAFTRPGDEKAKDFAKSLGALWAGDSDEMPPEPLDAAIIFASVGALVPAALKAVRKG